ncbi:MAG: DNA-directed RNA polymerase subunit RpoH/Rpb5 C-terminal domain-containing protein [Nanoarchaeota archaeon]
MVSKVDLYQVPNKHMKCSDSEKEKLCKKFGINTKDLPKILREDPAIKGLNVKSGDIIKIERKSKTAGIISYYREVVLHG